MTLKTRILIVDDEESIRFSLAETLTRDGHQVTAVESGEAALELVATETFDLALIDLNLPGIKGIEVLAVLRKQLPDIIIIVLTAHASLETAVEALRQGAHDYLFKPCKTVELRESIRRGLLSRQQQLRQRDLLRQLEQHLANSLENIRATIVEHPSPPPAMPVSERPTEVQPTPDEPTKERLAEEGRFLQRGGLVVDFLRHVITLDEHLLELSPTEFNLLAYLISEMPRVVPPQELVREVQGYESEQWEASEVVRYHIYRLRLKIKVATNRTDVIHTVRGVGYTVGE